MYFPVLYAETHYRLKYLLPFYFKREAEVLFDMPRSVLIKRTDKKIPIFLLVKDADKYPVSVSEIRLLGTQASCLQIKKHCRQDACVPSEIIFCNKPLQFFEFYLDIEDTWINSKISFNIEFKVNNKRYINDNYHGSTPHNFQVFISNQESLYPKGWYIGDTHYHSSYTSDQVEFGAPLEMTKKIAYSMGMDWFFVTDHSYDLDDREDDYTRNDPELEKWSKMKTECLTLSDDKMKIVFGEEVSIGNSQGQNVHLLVVNHPDFIEGKGDSAEKWFQNRPDVNIREIPPPTPPINVGGISPPINVGGVSPPTFMGGVGGGKIAPLFIAAHPFEKVPFLQKLTLNRGNWSEKDFEMLGTQASCLQNSRYVQMINGQSIYENIEQINKYFQLLLTGKEYYILAGNDAHGNFQFMKQINVPFVKLMCKKQQLFGQFFTAYQYKENTPIEGIQNKRIVVSNGAFLSFTVFYDEREYNIGDRISLLGTQTSCLQNQSFQTGCLHSKSNKAVLRYEFALMYPPIYEIASSGFPSEKPRNDRLVEKNIRLKMIIGDIKRQKLNKIKLDLDKTELEIDLKKNTFILLYLLTTNGYIALTNPVFIKN